MKKIKLTQGKYALVDNEDYEKIPMLSNRKWYLNNSGYAVRNQKYPKSRKDYPILMHRLILDFPTGIIDHKNLNPLDNRKENLRLATHSQNHGNMTKQKNNTSGYKGVWLNKLKGKNNKKWVANILFQGKKYSLGIHHTPKQAAQAYNKKAVELFGEFALVNKI